MRIFADLLRALGRFLLSLLFGRPGSPGPHPPPQSLDIARPADFEQAVQKLNGMMTALWMAAADEGMEEDKRRGILRDWERRIRNSDSEGLANAWQIATRANAGRPAICLARQWLAVLQSWGLHRDTAEEIVVDEDVYDSYALDTLEYHPGARARVIHPSWLLDGRVVEKGWASLGPARTKTFRV